MQQTSFMLVHSGKSIDLLDFKEEHVQIEDIAHALSMQCRFNGHTSKFYSVAEHSLQAKNEFMNLFFALRFLMRLQYAA